MPPIFKQKNTKFIKIDTKDEKNFVILDLKHEEFLKKFDNNENVLIPKLRQELKELQNVYKHTGATLPINEYYQMEDKIDKLKQQIKDLKNEKQEYMKNNSKILFDYYENKKQVELNLAENTNSIKLKKIHKFFNITDVSYNIKETINNNIVSTYLENIDDKYIDVNKFINTNDICTNCNKGEMIQNEDEGLLICNKCSVFCPYLIENEKPSYKEAPKEMRFFAYKRLNHFKEILAQFQAKETTQITDELIKRVKMQIEKEKLEMNDLALDINVMRDILKKLGYDSKYYEHITYIKYKLGINPPIMSTEIEELLYNDFSDLQYPYFLYCPPGRENFMNYHYTGYKLCERHNLKKYLPHFHMIKDRQKLREHDEIYKKCCKYLGWTFIPTI